MSEPLLFPTVPSGLSSALEGRGFTELTDIQRAVLAPELKGRDLRISSQTGSGKTVAIGFVLADELVELAPMPVDRRAPAQPQAVIVAPTRELAAQLHVELSWLFRPRRARIAVMTGGTNLGGDFRSLAAHPHLLIATPGRLADHIQRGSVDLSAASAVVLDEADEMLDMGFRDELEAILDRTPAERRTHMVSATFSPVVMRLASRYQRDAQLVAGSTPGAANDDIAHTAIAVHDADRVSALINLLLATPDERALVFVRTRADTATLAAELGGAGFSVSAMSGDLGQRERTATLAAFRASAVRVLVATDVAARGLDIAGVNLVVHFELPENADALTHRSGRTGRAGNKGTSIVFVPPRARGRATAMFRTAKVDVQWRPVPSAADIRRAADDRLVADLGQIPVDDRARALADRLLAGGDPAAIVAALVAQSRHVGPCEPRSVREVSPARSDLPGSAAAGSGRDGSGRYAAFQVSWGARHGANARRLLAMVCRRGDIRGNHVGAIRVGPNSSIVEVVADAAARFEAASRHPDARNPRIRIRPISGNPPRAMVG